MSDTNEEVIEAMDTSQKDNSSSDSETAKSEIIDVVLDQASMKSTSSLSSISVGDDKISSPEIVELIPESDSIQSVKRHKQEDNNSKANQHHPLSTEEPDKLTQAVDKCSKKTNDKEKGNESSKKPTKRPRLESYSDPENVSNSQKSSTSSEHSMSNNDNEALYTSKIPPEDPPKSSRDRSTLVNINNALFYTPQTRIIHKEYMKLFDFKEFRQARLLDINSYNKIERIAEFPLFLSRFLLEDLLDFVDFLNGTKAELFIPEKFTLYKTELEARKLLFMRANFETGIQQLESQTINHLLKQLDYFGCNDNNEETNIDVIDLVSETSSGNSSPINDRILQLDPDIVSMSIFDKIAYLGDKKREIMKSVFSCLCHTRLVLDFCLEPEYKENIIEELEMRLKKYLSDIKKILETLVKVRKECCASLLETKTDDDELNTIFILHMKIQVANVFKDLLLKLSTANAKLLEYGSL